MILAAITLLAPFGIHPRWEKLYEMPFPNNEVADYASVDSITKCVIFGYGRAGGMNDTNLYLPNERKIQRFGQRSLGGQVFDCQQGIFNFLSDKSDHSLYYSIRFRDGKTAGSISYQPGMRRIGTVIQKDETLMDLNGKVLYRGAKPMYGKSVPGYIGNLIWDGKRKLALIGQNNMPNDKKDVVEILPGWKKGKRSWLSDYAFGFNKIIGNPDTGTFAIYEESSRTEVCTGVFTKDLRRLMSGNLVVTDIGPGGVLACRTKSNYQLGEFQSSGKAFCMDCNTGKIKWFGPNLSSGFWMGDYVISGQNKILDGKTGYVVGNVPKHPSGFKREYGHDRDMFSAVTKNDKLAVYQLKL